MNTFLAECRYDEKYFVVADSRINHIEHAACPYCGRNLKAPTFHGQLTGVVFTNPITGHTFRVQTEKKKGEPIYPRAKASALPQDSFVLESLRDARGLQSRGRK